MDQIKDIQGTIKANEREIDANKNFKITTTAYEIKKIDLLQGTYTTNCIKCNRTCHFPCGIPNND